MEHVIETGFMRGTCTDGVGLGIPAKKIDDCFRAMRYSWFMTSTHRVLFVRGCIGCATDGPFFRFLTC